MVQLIKTSGSEPLPAEGNQNQNLDHHQHPVEMWVQLHRTQQALQVWTDPVGPRGAEPNYRTQSNSAQEAESDPRADSVFALKLQVL